ncbi:MAG: biotin--[acetyl-CoA-carboxylase] ligase [Rhodospirillaceae bacterium]|nr:biotin--[acetyl-CoA-carboxylase] ligase [Rhodospirillaceae bacterium]
MAEAPDLAGRLTWPPAVPAGWRLEARDSVTSTNAEAGALAAAGCAERTVVVAREQTVGRGRQGRSWTSPPGNLYASVVLRPHRPLAEAAQLTFVIALALADGIAALGPSTPPRLKWPNDVLVGGAKISGILLESESAGGPNAAWVIAGTGVNIAHHPADAAIAATHLAEHMARPVSIGDLLHAYLTALDGWYGRWMADGFAPVRTGWLDRAQGLGETVRVRTARETFSGRFDSLTADGALVVTTEDGLTRQVTAGDVMFGGARAAGD